MDRGFKQWIARLLITYTKKFETPILEKERTSRIIREEQIRTRCRRCGWSAISCLVQGFSTALFFTGVFLAFFFFLVAVSIIGGSLIFMACQLPIDQCIQIEVRHSKTNDLILSNEQIWGWVEVFQHWYGAVSFTMNELMHVPDEFLIKTRTHVCQVSKISVTANALKLMSGVYKIF